MGYGLWGRKESDLTAGLSKQHMSLKKDFGKCAASTDVNVVPGPSIKWNLGFLYCGGCGCQ